MRPEQVCNEPVAPVYESNIIKTTFAAVTTATDYFAAANFSPVASGAMSNAKTRSADSEGWIE